MADLSQTPPPLRILILDDEATIRTTLTLCLEAAGHGVTGFGTGEPALQAAGTQVFDLLFLDLRLGMENGLDYIPRFLQQSPWLKIIVITAYASIDTAVEAMRRGASDYLPKPFTPEHVEMLAAKVAETRSLEMRLRGLVETLDASVPPASLATSNRAFRAALQLAHTFAASNAAVLLQGESGTGKRTLARAVHQWSSRRDAPFTVCSAQENEKDLAVELFGLEGAAQNGALRSRLEHGAGGTLYIDGIDVLSSRLQSKLLQFIQTGKFEREEGFEQVPADVRILAGTNKPLAKLAGAGQFRDDLFYMFSAKAIELPPLRERSEDFQTLAESLLAFYARQNGKPVNSFKREAMDYLRSYAWPGNIRELRNVVERAVILARGSEIGIQDLPPNLRTCDSAATLGDLVTLDAIEELHIRGVLANTGSLETAAKILGVDYATLWRRRKKYGL